MYSVLFWKDHAVTPDKTFTVRENGDGTITLIPAGKIIQQGTNMSAFNFNNMEQGILAANITGIEALRLIGFLQTKTEALEGQIIEATLTNSRKYPFNDSGATLPLDDSNPRNNQIIRTTRSPWRRRRQTVLLGILLFPTKCSTVLRLPTRAAQAA